MLSPAALYHQQRCWIPCRQYTTSIMLHWHLSTLPYRTSFWSTASHFCIEQGSPLCLSGSFELGFYQCQIFQWLCGNLPWGDSWCSLSSQLLVVNSDISFLLFPVTLKFVEIFFELLRRFGCCWSVVQSLLHLAALNHNLLSTCCWCNTTNTNICSAQNSSTEQSSRVYTGVWELKQI